MYNPWSFPKILFCWPTSRTLDRSWPAIRIHLNSFLLHLPWKKRIFFVDFCFAFFFSASNTLLNTQNVSSIVMQVSKYSGSPLEKHQVVWLCPGSPRKCYHAYCLCHECKQELNFSYFLLVFYFQAFIISSLVIYRSCIFFSMYFEERKI